MKNFLIYVNASKDKDLKLTGRIHNYLDKKGCICSIYVKEEEESSQRLWNHAECILVLGGDGTMLQAARDTRHLDCPMIGINLGTLGYMTEIERDDLEDSLDRLIMDCYYHESRMLLQGTVYRDGKELVRDLALNDIVLSRLGSLRIIKYHIYLNHQFLSEYQADGVILTTPTGSTGYNLSAGGPIVEPGARLIAMTPICPHTLSQRSIIFSPEDVVEIRIPGGREGQMQEVEAAFDGSHSLSLKTGDVIRITGAEESLHMLRLNKVSFLQLLHEKVADKISDTISDTKSDRIWEEGKDERGEGQA